MNKYLSLTILSVSTAFLSLVSGATPALAASRQVVTPHTPVALTMPAEPSHFHPNRRWLMQNQHFHGDTFSWQNYRFRGHNMNNGGNQGYNRGHNISFDGNGGNLISTQSHTGRQHVNQYFYGNSYSHNKGYFVGDNQTNGGNQGYNVGYNEDHGANAGNQIVN